jgi:hypothetical protein
VDRTRAIIDEINDFSGSYQRATSHGHAQKRWPYKVIHGDLWPIARVRNASQMAIGCTESATPNDDLNDLAHKFYDLVATWREETQLSSSMNDIIMHPAYQRIIGLGPAVIPLILRELQVNGGHWFWALQALTGENPVSPDDAGRIKNMAHAWIEWGRVKGIID